jgi:peptidoglycan/LPS O-acetylase OafA/YrhL
VSAPSTELAGTRRRPLGYLPGIDGLRALSVLAVLVYHHYFVGGHEPGFAPGGYLGVEVFFVVSGYLITSLLLAERRETGTISLRRFWMRRARRLLPALWCLLAVLVAYTLLFLPDSIEKLKGDVVAALTYTSNWWQIVVHRSYFQDVGRPDLLKHLWSLAIEEQFYLLWPPVFVLGLRKFGKRKFVTSVVGVALLSAVWMAVLAPVSVDRAYYGTDTRMSGLLLGSAMAFGFAPWRIRGVPGRGARYALDLVGLLGLAVLLWSFTHLTITGADGSAGVFRGGFLLVDVATLAVIAAVVHPVADLGSVLGCKPLRWIGLRSYSLYLWHYPIFAITRPGGAGSGGDFEHFFHLTGWPVFWLRFGLSFGAAELSYRFVETPIRDGALSRYLERVRTADRARKWRLATRGIGLATSLTAVTVLLGAGLVTAQPSTPNIPGLDTKSAKNDRADRVDPRIAAALLSATTTTTARARPPVATSAVSAKRRSTTTTRGTAKTTPTTTHRSGKATPTTTRRSATTASPPTTAAIARAAALPPAVLAVGDSVLLGARAALQAAIPGIGVDAVVSRQFWDAIALLRGYNDLRALPQVVVIHLGTNGAFSDAQFDSMMQILGRQRHVYFLTAREPRTWEPIVNERLHAGATRWPNVKIVEWHDYANPHADWFVSDGVHLTALGRMGYADLVRRSISGG